MKRLKFFVTSDGKLPEGVRETLKWLIPTFAGKQVELTLGEAKDKRSLEANSYYWAVILPHVRKVRFENGDPVSEEAVHEDLLVEFAPRVEAVGIKTMLSTRPMRSKEMNVHQFSHVWIACSNK